MDRPVQQCGLRRCFGTCVHRRHTVEARGTRPVNPGGQKDRKNGIQDQTPQNWPRCSGDFAIHAGRGGLQNGRFSASPDLAKTAVAPPATARRQNPNHRFFGLFKPPQPRRWSTSLLPTIQACLACRAAPQTSPDARHIRRDSDANPRRSSMRLGRSFF